MQCNNDNRLEEIGSLSQSKSSTNVARFFRVQGVWRGVFIFNSLEHCQESLEFCCVNVRNNFMLSNSSEGK